MKTSSKDIRLFFCGDFCSRPSTSHISVSADVKSLLNSCDLKICNFEGTLKPDKGRPINKIPPNIFQHDDAPSFLESLGFNVISLANNHSFDFGESGFLKTKQAFSQAKIIGAGTFEEVYKVDISVIKGYKIGLLSVSYACFGTFDNMDAIEVSNPVYGIANMDHLCINHIIMEAKKEVDFLFIYVHDGIEYTDLPLVEQRYRYRDFIDYGADGVVAHHSHTPQGWEIYKDKPIFYSLGNFFFNSKESPAYRAKSNFWYNGLAVVLHISAQTGQLSYEVHNILNKGNTFIQIDDSPAIKIHTEDICGILNDNSRYNQELYVMLNNLWEEKYLPLMSSSFFNALRKYNFFLLIRVLLRSLTKKDDDVILYSFLKNKCHNANMVRVIKNKRDFY